MYIGPERLQQYSAQDNFKYDYFRRFLYHKINQDYTLEQIFSSMKLDDMQEGFCKGYSYEKETKLTEAVAHSCKKISDG